MELAHEERLKAEELHNHRDREQHVTGDKEIEKETNQAILRLFAAREKLARMRDEYEAGGGSSILQTEEELTETEEDDTDTVSASEATYYLDAESLVAETNELESSEEEKLEGEDENEEHDHEYHEHQHSARGMSRIIKVVRTATTLVNGRTVPLTDTSHFTLMPTMAITTDMQLNIIDVTGAMSTDTTPMLIMQVAETMSNTLFMANTVIATTKRATATLLTTTATTSLLTPMPTKTSISPTNTNHHHAHHHHAHDLHAPHKTPAHIKPFPPRPSNPGEDPVLDTLWANCASQIAKYERSEQLRLDHEMLDPALDGEYSAHERRERSAHRERADEEIDAIAQRQQEEQQQRADRQAGNDAREISSYCQFAAEILGHTQMSRVRNAMRKADEEQRREHDSESIGRTQMARVRDAMRKADGKTAVNMTAGP